MARQAEQRRGTPWLLRALVAGLVIGLLAGVGLLLQSTQTTAKQRVADRFTARAGLAGHFIATYTNQLIAREKSVALATLSAAGVSGVSGPFDSDVRAFGFSAAVLLSSDGKSLAIAPYSAAFIGQPLGAEYAHLRLALQGHAAVSNVVTSAVRAVPVVAFAVPFQTPQGRRVFSGAYAASDTPIAAFLNDTTTLKGAHLFLVDAKGTVIATNGSAVASVRTLTDRDPTLARASSTHDQRDLPRWIDQLLLRQDTGPRHLVVAADRCPDKGGIRLRQRKQPMGPLARYWPASR